MVKYHQLFYRTDSQYVCVCVYSCKISFLISCNFYLITPFQNIQNICWSKLYIFEIYKMNEMISFQINYLNELWA